MTKYKITFGEHIPAQRISGMVSGIAAYGNVLGEGREYAVEIFRVSKAPRLEKRLVAWDEHGFLSWEKGQ